MDERERERAEAEAESDSESGFINAFSVCVFVHKLWLVQVCKSYTSSCRQRDDDDDQKCAEELCARTLAGGKAHKRAHTHAHLLRITDAHKRAFVCAKERMSERASKTSHRQTLTHMRPLGPAWRVCALAE